MDTLRNVSHVSKFKKNDKKKESQKKIKRNKRRVRERKRERGKGKKSFFSKIYENRIVDFHRSKRQSQSMHRELHMGIKILEFHQTPRGKEFFDLGYF